MRSRLIFLLIGIGNAMQGIGLIPGTISGALPHTPFFYIQWAGFLCGVGIVVALLYDKRKSGQCWKDFFFNEPDEEDEELTDAELRAQKLRNKRWEYISSYGLIVLFALPVVIFLALAICKPYPERLAWAVATYASLCLMAVPFAIIDALRREYHALLKFENAQSAQQ